MREWLSTHKPAASARNHVLLAALTWTLVGLGLLSAGTFWAFTRGAAIGHVSPEAAGRGPIAILETGDVISIDIPNNKLEVELSESEIKERLAKLPEFEPRVKSGFLRRYAEKVSSASTGAVFTE